MSNFDRIKNMTVDELSMFLQRVNTAYDWDCMVGVADCKHPEEDNGCALCFAEWLQSSEWEVK